ncbi:MAG: Fe-S cluster assembly sulfur transfer protein SufU [Gammaproteobacteria bacterium]
MNELQDLYREVILDHNRSPRNFGELEDADRIIEGVNPLCGDKMTLYLKLDGDTVEDIRFTGTGCAISVASSSLMTERVKGETRTESLKLFDRIHDMLTAPEFDAESSNEDLEKLAVLSGVREYPTRVKCASLAWHALKNALAGSGAKVTTE